MKALLLAGCLFTSTNLLAQTPAPSTDTQISIVELRARGARLQEIIRSARASDDAAFAREVSPAGEITIDSENPQRAKSVQPLTAKNLRDLIGTCVPFDQISVSLAREPYSVFLVLQCSTGDLLGDVRASFQFENGLLTKARFGEIVYSYEDGKAQTNTVFAPLQPQLLEHHVRVTAIEALLTAMAGRDPKAFAAAGGASIAFSRDAEVILSALTAPGASRLDIDSLASLRACKAGRPLSTESDWYSVSWECPNGAVAGNHRYLFKFAGRNLIAVQAGRQPPKNKIN